AAGGGGGGPGGGGPGTAGGGGVVACTRRPYEHRRASSIRYSGVSDGGLSPPSARRRVGAPAPIVRSRPDRPLDCGNPCRCGGGTQVPWPPMLQLFDTAKGAVAPFEPREPGKVSMYVCGPTVYGPPHLGHGRFSLVFDVLRRYLRWSGYEVTYVSNITDIDDKIIDRAKREQR